MIEARAKTGMAALCATAGSLVSERALMNVTGRTLLLPYYHTITDARLPHVCHLYQLRSKARFVEDVEYLCRQYTPVSLRELDDCVRGRRRIDKPLFHLSFDDGLREIHSEIAPILLRKGIPATFFINTDFVDNRAMFYRHKASVIIERMVGRAFPERELAAYLHQRDCTPEALSTLLLSLDCNAAGMIDDIARILEIDLGEYLREQQPYLRCDQIRELLGQGFTIGSHSLSHPYFGDIGIDERKRQVRESFDYLAREFGIGAYYFSFPFSDAPADRAFMHWLHGEAQCRLSFGISGLKDDCTKFHLHRIPLERHARSARHTVKGAYLYSIALSLLGKASIARQ